jgi:phosphate transport system permease protein
MIGKQWLSWYRSGSPWVWLNAGAVTVCMLMVIGLIAVIAVRGFGHFWTPALVEVAYTNEHGVEETLLGRVLVTEPVAGGDSGRINKKPTRVLIGTANRDLSAEAYRWLPEENLRTATTPQDALIVERSRRGDFYGYPVALLQSGNPVLAATDEQFVEQLQVFLQRTRQRQQQLHELERKQLAPVSEAMQNLLLQQSVIEKSGLANAAVYRQQEMAEQQAVFQEEYDALYQQRLHLLNELAKDALQVKTVSGEQLAIPLADIVRIAWPNRMLLTERIADYTEKFVLFVSSAPREANTAGGIFPAIFGTVVMVLVMSVLVTPFGVLAAIFLHEYAKQGWFVRLVRISVYNLAGVPSIVYGIFGLGFFVYIVGGGIDRLFYESSLPAPVFGTPGLFWAALTMALLTLPVVIVSTEEGLSRIPVSIRHGSFALGATRTETIWKVVVPLATPAMMTGLILAIARAAGEVAPLMLVGVVKLAPALPIDGSFPYVHLDRKIMHLGYHIYDSGFQSANIDGTRSLVYASCLVLLLLIVMLNMTAIRIRNNLRRKYRDALE